MTLILLIVLTHYIFSDTAYSQEIYTIQETEDNIISGARKMIYNDSLLALIDVSRREIYLISREGEITKKITPSPAYSDSITTKIGNSYSFYKFVKFGDIKKRNPNFFGSAQISDYYTHQIYDCTIYSNKIGYTSRIVTFVPESDTSTYFSLVPLLGFISEPCQNEVIELRVDLIRPIENTATSGLNDLFYYGKYSNTFLSNCYNEDLDRYKNSDSLDFKLYYRFIEYNREIEPIRLVQVFPKELSYYTLDRFLKDRVTQTSDSAFWAIGNYHDIVYNLKNGEKFKLNTPGNNCAKYIERLLYFERNFKDSLRIMHKIYKDYLNFQVISIDATPEDDLIIDLLHATINQETGKKEQYHILQKYSRSGELLGEKVFPQDGKLGSLQRIAYCAKHDEFAFLIFKDEKWLLAYSEEDKVW